MYSDWQAEARKRIVGIDAIIGPDATWQERQKLLRTAAYGFHGGTSWGKRVWAKHCRNYLALHGKPQPKGKAPLFEADITFPFRNPDSTAPDPSRGEA